MLPFQKILCPTDYSEASLAALDKAVELASHFGATLGLVHVVENLPPLAPELGFVSFDVRVAEQDALAEATRKLQAIVEGRVPSGVKVFTSVRLGHAAAEIVRLAEQEDADLIVIATHGLTGWRHLVFGSVAEKVVQTAPCTVLTVRAPAHAPVHDKRRESGAETFVGAAM